ncbi:MULTISPECIES: CDP-glucose 4,6-dehydratase [unclassified Paenibacillus]|uniref:CDP-glucose 4,6-dehydratase n=1 Tax=unclassified Paenibacillus TaxID=185978 RepID=UPI001C116FBB|nr:MULTISPECIES: CDP-glucose 4,6-dehydratase [unclassified Paenibacillus]MBU5440804.1 CDP-glucose 4,6-dehydratase [Paenibacillus sp. MSJ-34]CAH0118500.1 CDP-glucose 4,6-dehydratase [Paenibacillus sp. CECT 9249]
MVRAAADRTFWRNKKVFVTGHTGFKGSWLCLLLVSLGAKPYGYALRPHTEPSMFDACRLHEIVPTVYADIGDAERLFRALDDCDPDIVFHMAAQPLVRESYANPLQTYQTNVMGTVHLLDAVRRRLAANRRRTRAVINVTSDKCYENNDWPWGYRETDPLGGSDPYSNSKACSELVSAAYRRSYFHPDRYPEHSVSLATARAGNVIGGGDWARDRLVPDCIRSLLAGEQVAIRYPHAIRPWQHVLEPLSGYLTLARKCCENGAAYAQSWNFGPADEDVRTVESVVQTLCLQWGASAAYEIAQGVHPYEAHTLRLDCSKARTQLGWRPIWKLDQALFQTVDWVRAYARGEDMRAVTLRQIAEYEAGLAAE